MGAEELTPAVVRSGGDNVATGAYEPSPATWLGINNKDLHDREPSRRRGWRDL